TPQLRALPGWNVIVQPRNRETGPGMLLSLLVLARRQPDATVAVFPSDHHIGDERKFRTHVARMARLVDAHPDRIALLGVDPERLASAYPTIAPWNFSRDFLARIPEHLMVTRAPGVRWSDWGTPEAIERSLAASGIQPPWQLPLRATA